MSGDRQKGMILFEKSSLLSMEVPFVCIEREIFNFNRVSEQNLWEQYSLQTEIVFLFKTFRLNLACIKDETSISVVQPSNLYTLHLALGC